MRNGKNIEELKSRLLTLDFPGGLEAGLRAQICLQKGVFTRHYRQLREGDVLNVSLQFQRAAESPDDHCLYYDACLRKPVDISAADYGEEGPCDLEARMKQIDWINALPTPCTEETAHHAPALSREKEDAIESIVSGLNKLGETADGQALVHRLKMKFWADTPLEAFIPNLSRQKSSLEISQRYYFFEGEAGITLDEAYRFLCHRWRERQWNAQKKDAGAGLPMNLTTAKSTAEGASSCPKSSRVKPLSSNLKRNKAWKYFSRWHVSMK